MPVSMSYLAEPEVVRLVIEVGHLVVEVVRLMVGLLGVHRLDKRAGEAALLLF